MSLNDELIAIRLELKGQREAISGIHSVDKAQKGLGTSTAAAGTAAEKAEKKTSRLSRAYGALGKAAKYGLGFLGVAGVLALHTAVANTEELSKTTVGLTRNFDLQNNVASRWAAVAHSRDIDSKALGMTFGVLSTKLTNAAREGGKALLPFHQLGLTQEDAAKGAHNFQWGIMRVAKALGEEEGGAKRAAAAKALLGKGYTTLLPLFSEGTKGLKEQLHWADEYGVTLSGHTNEAIMEMVTAQRESKVAMLGLQIAMTKALMPAIEGGERELQKFIKTLNDPKLTDDQKFHRIEQQFLGIEDTLIEVITDALPRVAEHGGELGVKLAGAVWNGFEESDLGGKLVITGWLLNFMGGGGLIRKTAGTAGGMMARGLIGIFAPTIAADLAAGGTIGQIFKARFQELGKWSGRMFATGMILGVALLGWWVGTEIGNHLSNQTKLAIKQWGINAGENFVNALIWVVNKGIAGINQAFDDANILSALGVSAPEIGEIGGVNFHSPLEEQERFVKRHLHEGVIDGPGGKPIFPNGKPAGPKHRRADTPRLPRLSLGALGNGSGRPIVVENHIHLDGKEIAESTAHHVAAAEALA